MKIEKISDTKIHIKIIQFEQALKKIYEELSENFYNKQRKIKTVENEIGF